MKTNGDGMMRAPGKNKKYLAVPRDRDQVFHVTQGFLPKLASKPYLLPTLQNFGGKIEDPKFSLFKSSLFKCISRITV